MRLQQNSNSNELFPSFMTVCLLFASNLSIASDYGTTGLIDTPTARMQRDGVFSTTAAFDGRHRQFAITYQAAPWLEGTFRYTGFDEFFHWDRNYEFKARLWEEGDYLPVVAIGIRDLIGQGWFGSEYIVATKGFAAGTDISIGAGWGRLAGKGVIRNPATLLSDRFNVRNAEAGEGGQLSIDNFFSGPDMGVFGGVKHRFSGLPLTAMAEYNPDQYDFNVSNGGARPKSPISVGLTWDLSPGVAVTTSYQHGEEVALAFQFSLDSTVEPPRRAPDEFISSHYLSPSKFPAGFNKKRWYDRLLLDVERSGLLLLEGSLSKDQQQAQLIVGNASYPLWSDAIGRLTALADLHLPVTVKTIHFIVEDAGHRTATITLPRPSATYPDNQSQLRRIQVLSGRSLNHPQHKTDFKTGKINNTLNLRTRFQLFDPDDPARYQVYADFSSEYSLSAHWAMRSSISLNIDQNFDESKRQDSGSVLPRVRSDVVRYLNEGASGLDRLIIEGRNSYKRSIHYRAYAGVLEEMFSGVGGEILYWPHKSRIALGASIAYAKQRDYDRRLDHLDYDVVTGHLSAYWATPFYNYDVAVHAGQYLARDMGATVEVRRTFRNGWQIGAWATTTDVSSEDFGEGSFDKGFYFQVPLDSLFGTNRRSKFAARIRPIQRDGGQRLESYSGTIFFDLREARYDAFAADERLLP